MEAYALKEALGLDMRSANSAARHASTCISPETSAHQGLQMGNVGSEQRRSDAAVMGYFLQVLKLTAFKE